MEAKKKSKKTEKPPLRERIGEFLAERAFKILDSLCGTSGQDEAMVLFGWFGCNDRVAP